MMNQHELHTLVEKTEPNICQIVCYQDGKQQYADAWNQYKQTDAVHIMSATKSIVALLIGICVDRGLIGSIDGKVLDYFPDYTVKRGEKTIYEVTLRHLLTMTAPYKGKNEPWTKVCTSEDWTHASLDFLGGRGGITGEFRYTTVCLHILTGILARVSGKTPADFANEALFVPLGIAPHKHFLAQTAAEHKAFIMGKTPKDHVWFGDPLGVGCAGYGLCCSADALAKIGLLCLNRGVFEGKRLVSEQWIAQMTAETHQCGEVYGNMRYGMLWWLIDEDIYAAIGNSGNVIYVNRAHNFVAGVTAYFKPSVLDRVDFIRNYLDKV